MAKKSTLARNEKRIQLVAKFAAKRAELKKILKDPNITDEEFYAAQRKLTKLPKDSNPNKIRNRCSISGRPRAFIRKYGVSRITFRELASSGLIPGVTKSSW